MAVEFLHELNVPFFKVGSGDTNNFPYLEKTAKKGESGPSDPGGFDIRGVSHHQGVL